MKAKTLSVKLTGSDGDGGDVILDDLREFCGALTSCLRTLERRVEVPARLDYRVVGLRHGSCGLTILPAADEADTGAGDEVLDLFNDTVRALQTGKRLDPRLDSHALNEFKKLAQPFKSRVRSIKFGRFPITNRFTENIDKLLARPAEAEGEATGFLDRIDAHGRRSFTLFPNMGGPIKCDFDDKLVEKVRAGLLHNVTVYGTFKYFLGSPFPGTATVVDLEIHPDDDELPSLSDLRGRLANGVANG